MRRASLIVWLVAMSVLAALWLPSLALAGTYSWDQPANFTSSAPGANPDQDTYGGTPWSYLATAGATNTPLSPFSSDVAGTGLSGWGGGAGQPLIAANPGASVLTSATATYLPAQLVLRPASNQAATVEWTSPLTGTVQISGTLAQDDTGSLGCPYSTAWAVNLAGGQGSIASGSLPSLPPGSGSFSNTVNVVRGQAIDLIVSNGVLGNAACDATGVTLHIAAMATPPVVTLSRPGNLALISTGQPAFAGSAGQDFGDSATVAIRVYAGNSASGSPVQTITAHRSGGSYSAAPVARLPNGMYTAQAEQDDAATPPDVGLSAAVTFTVHDAAPTIALRSPSAKPLLTATPTLTGTAGSGAVSANAVALTIYPGPDTSTSPVRFIPGSVVPSRRFSIEVTPGLEDGRYTAIAVALGSGTTSFSQPVTFRIKVHAPAVTVDEPAPGTSAGAGHPQFSGAAGNGLGDSRLVSVFLYAGAGPSARRLGSMRVRRTGGRWSGRFPFRIGPGRYAARAQQSDDAGHTSLSRPVAFRVVPAVTTIGSPVALSGHSATVPITCLAPSGVVCTGDVLILTVGSFQPAAGGPVGKLRLLFAYVRIRGGETLVVQRAMAPGVAGAIRRAGAVQVRVTASLSQSGGPPRRSEALRSVTIEP